MATLTNEQIIEGNKLIAEFMNLDYRKLKKFEFGGNVIDGTAEDLEYDYSWEWLMPVVEKIESEASATFSIYGLSASITSTSYRICGHSSTKILAAWEACLNFIHWYNLQKEVQP